MAHPEPDELAALALDPEDASEAVRAHVSTCAQCRAFVDSLVGVRRLAGHDALVAPSAGLRERVLAEALGDAAPDVSTGSTGSIAPTDQLRERRAARPARRGGIPLWMAGLAAAAALVVGVGLGNVLDRDDAGSPEDEAAVLASAELTTVEGTEPRGSARVVKADGVVTVHVEARALDDSELQEVWLLNVDGTRMVSLGFLPVGDEGDFEVPARLLDEGYRILDISVEPDDGDPTHSGVSLARGELV